MRQQTPLHEHQDWCNGCQNESARVLLERSATLNGDGGLCCGERRASLWPHCSHCPARSRSVRSPTHETATPQH